MTKINFGGETDKKTMHTSTFHLINKNNELLEEFLADTSNPKSPNYGKHLTMEQVHELTSDKEGMALIQRYLSEHNVPITKQTHSSITVEANIGTWELLLHTTFYDIPDPRNPALTVPLAKSYFLPDIIAPHVSTVSNTIQPPIVVSRGPAKRQSPAVDSNTH
eukprot:CAMPEP_0174954394 /NCGR_PEP_ID=MMETSP0004_2-20121128/398_1 /TAXON_ID=420556 /ORGANISM="Ochromonas sp., Strain CCMP1393" /LENGTH=162 /DNA_ID=CAMNT_0016202199 /DNA_START=129 /DNA_END=617 /DNA_ORIENTATION=-